MCHGGLGTAPRSAVHPSVGRAFSEDASQGALSTCSFSAVGSQKPLSRWTPILVPIQHSALFDPQPALFASALQLLLDEELERDPVELLGVLVEAGVGEVLEDHGFGALDAFGQGRREAG